MLRTSLDGRHLHEVIFLWFLACAVVLSSYLLPFERRRDRFWYLVVVFLNPVLPYH